MAKEMASYEHFKVKVDSNYVELKLLEKSGQQPVLVRTGWVLRKKKK